MKKSDKDRLFNLVDSAVEPLEKSAAYDAIALAERDETNDNARELLHEAALEIMRGNLDRTKHLLAAIEADPE